MTEPVFSEPQLRKVRLRWWQVRRRLRTRRFRRELREQLKQEGFQFMGRREDFKVWGDLPQLDVPPGGDPRKHMPPVEWKVRAEGEAETLKRLGIGPDESLRWYQNRRSQD